MMDGVSVAPDPQGGRGACLLAARAFEAGQVVLQESPSWFVRLDDVDGNSPGAPDGEARDDLLGAVCAASGAGRDENLPRSIAAQLELWMSAGEDTRRELVDTFFSAPDKSSEAPKEERMGGVGQAAEDEEEGGGMEEFFAGVVEGVQARWAPLALHGTEDLTRFLLTWLLSAHSSTDSATGETGSCLYAIGHRSNHSCEPNTVYQNGEVGHTLVLRTLKAVGKGEPLSISYLSGDELMAPCGVRRRVLAARKFFHCLCSRCVASGHQEEGEPGRVLPCKRCSIGRLTFGPMMKGGRDNNPSPSPSSLPHWRCSGSCGEGPGAAPDAETLAEEEALVEEALAGGGPLRRGGGWEQHWVTSVAMWAEALRGLRGGIEAGDFPRARAAYPLLEEYFSWCRERWPRCPHFASSQAAEVYACLTALMNVNGGGGSDAGSADVEQRAIDKDAAAALCSRLCAPYMAALENEYGAEDGHNRAMRVFLGSHCGHCGRAEARSKCSGCRLVAYCGAPCQKVAWKAYHKRDCCSTAATAAAAAASS